MSYLLTTVSGRTAVVRSDELARSERIAGLDHEGRVVVDDFDARTAEPQTVAGYICQPFMFGLTLCCQASDKGTEWGNVCRACYGDHPEADEGWYLFRRPDGTFPELDPIKSLNRIKEDES